jgi:hypothetical protein
VVYSLYNSIIIKNYYSAPKKNSKSFLPENEWDLPFFDLGVYKDDVERLAD